MHFLICSDGMPAADDATRLGGLLATACKTGVTLLGIAEKPVDEQPLREALETQAGFLRTQGLVPQIVIGSGEPVLEIKRRVAETNYDLVVIGSRRRRSSGLYWRSQKTYEVIKAIASPVLVAVGEPRQMKKFLVCTGGQPYISGALELTGKLAAAAGAEVVLLHVMAEPPAMYANLVRLEDDAEAFLAAKSMLALNLQKQRADLEKTGVKASIRVRHGLVVEQAMAESRQRDYDLLVTGSSTASRMVRYYMMGDVTRSILNRSEIPVLVARSSGSFGLFGWLRRIFGR